GGSAGLARPRGSAGTRPSAAVLEGRGRAGGPGGGAGPSLQAVSVAYLQSNLPPVLKRVSVEPPGVVRERLPYAAEPDPQDLAFTGIRVNPDTGALTSQPPPLPEKRSFVNGLRALA